MSDRPFKVLGIQQIAVGGTDKQRLRKLWVDTLGLKAVGTFRSEREMLLSNKPPEATQVCVTVANAEHGVVDPTVFECVPLPL